MFQLVSTTAGFRQNVARLLPRFFSTHDINITPLGSSCFEGFFAISWTGICKIGFKLLKKFSLISAREVILINFLILKNNFFLDVPVKLKDPIFLALKAARSTPDALKIIGIHANHMDQEQIINSLRLLTNLQKISK